MAQVTSRGIDPGSLTPEELHVLAKTDFSIFTQVMYRAAKSGEDLIWAPYLDLVCAKLGDVAFGRLRNLIITLPPRHLKSFCVSVCLPAFVLGHFPEQQIMVVSYGQELARELARDCLAVMECGTYKEFFGPVLIPARQQLQALRTSQGGMRRATSIDGTATGTGADLMIFDDPQKPGETFSEAIRRTTNAAYENIFQSRGNNPQTVRRVIVMQRLHEDDFVGHVLGLGGNWEIINLPAIAEEDQLIPFDTPLGPLVYRRREGEALHPGRVPLPELDLIRQAVGEAVWAGQYQQRPAPAGGGLVKTEWFKRYTRLELPEAFDRVIQSWDTANTVAEWSDFSVCTTWGVKGRHVYLLHVFRKRLEYPELKRAVLDQAKIHNATTVFVEDRASGTQLYQEFRREGYGRLRSVKPAKDKATRMINQTAVIENGFVHIPETARWLPEYLHELQVFPNGKYDDQVDSTSQALETLNDWTNGSGFLEFIRQEQEAERERAEAVFIVQAPAGMNLLLDIKGGEHRPTEDGCYHLNAEQYFPVQGLPGWKLIRGPLSV